MKYSLGIDTSCYTTSVCIVSEKNEIIYNYQQILDVPEGKKGLRQSVALFQHINNLPIGIKNAMDTVNPIDIKCVCASIKPRPVDNSYMPVFLASQNQGMIISDILKIPFYQTTHQENHIMAGVYSSDIKDDDFYAIHLSGGTTELLSVCKSNLSYDIEILGQTQDIHAGQLIDRIGVAMGLPFPSGMHMEQLAQQGKEGNVSLPSFMRQGYVGFSGVETKALRLVESGIPNNDIALEVFNCITRTLNKWIEYAFVKYGKKKVLLIGGVACNSIIRSTLNKRLLKNRIKTELFFTKDIKLSKDNAVGCAIIGIDRLKGLEK